MGSNRDDFSQKTKNALALRANYKCSFTGCGLPTSGPNDASDDAVTKIGVAAHIHAAAPRASCKNSKPSPCAVMSLTWRLA